jgi:hypothetical protein
MRVLRFRVRTLLIAVAVAAILAWLGRPYPFAIEEERGGQAFISWSNGSVTEAGPCDLLPRSWRVRGPLVAVEWSDGSTSWHWQIPYQHKWVWWISSGPD